MPPIVRCNLRQKAVYWPFLGLDSYGEPVVGPPVEIDCRWVPTQAEAGGNQSSVQSPGGSLVLNRAVAVGSQVWLGELEDWYGTGSDGGDDQVMQVISYDETKDLKGRVSGRQARVQRRADGPKTS